MPTFVFIYHGGKKPDSPEAIETEMAKWMTWLGGLGANVVDAGHPVGMSKTVYKDKVADDGGANPTSGYSLIKADNIDDAVAKAKGCPILESGGSIEIAEAMEM